MFVLIQKFACGRSHVIVVISGGLDKWSHVVTSHICLVTCGQIQDVPSLTKVVVAVAGAVRAQLVEDRHHLLALRERAHCK